MRDNRLTCILKCLCMVSPGSPNTLAQSYQPHRTEYDHPNLQGVWNFYSRTPLERLKRLGEIELVTEIHQAPPAPIKPGSARPVSPSAGAYNSFWNKSGIQASYTRTFVHPANGASP